MRTGRDGGKLQNKGTAATNSPRWYSSKTLWMSFCVSGDVSWYSCAHCEPSSYASSFHAWNAAESTTVGWITSAPGKTPHVTALGPGAVLERKSPCLLTAWYVIEGLSFKISRSSSTC